MQKYLITQIENVHGGKGFIDNTIETKYVSKDEIFQFVKHNDEFHSEIEDFGELTSREELEAEPGCLVSIDDRLGGEDGYTNSTYSYIIKCITQEEYRIYKRVIQAYAEL